MTPLDVAAVASACAWVVANVVLGVAVRVVARWTRCRAFDGELLGIEVSRGMISALLTVAVFLAGVLVGRVVAHLADGTGLLVFPVLGALWVIADVAVLRRALVRRDDYLIVNVVGLVGSCTFRKDAESTEGGDR